MTAERPRIAETDEIDHHMFHYLQWKELHNNILTPDESRLYFRLLYSFGEPLKDSTLQSVVKRSTFQYHLIGVRRVLDHRYQIYYLHEHKRYVLSEDREIGDTIEFPSLWERLSDNPAVLQLQYFLSTAEVKEIEGQKRMFVCGSRHDIQVMQLLIDQYDSDPDTYVPHQTLVESAWKAPYSKFTNTARTSIYLLKKKLEGIQTPNVNYTIESDLRGRRLLITTL